MKGLLSLLAVLAIAATLPTAAVAQNVLANPGFEAGGNGLGAPEWIFFGNMYTEGANPPAIVPYEGTKVMKMFGQFWGVFNVGGIFQEFPTSPGAEWNLSSKSRHWSGDPLIGQLPTGNWVVQKIVFKDAGDAEIGAVESVILDGTYATDVWHNNAVISGTAPAGTVQIEAFILFLQPLYDGGAALIDNVVLTQTPKDVAVDLHPGSCPNPLSLMKKGVVPAAILGGADFDVQDIDVATVRLAGVAPKGSRIIDVATPFEGGDCDCTTDGADGHDDLILKFLSQSIIDALPLTSFKEEVTLTITGYLLDGTPILGSDCMVIVGAPKDLGGGKHTDQPKNGSETSPLSLNVRNEGPGTRIEYVLPVPTEVTLSVYDVSGRLVDRLVQSYESAGSHNISWNSTSHPSGIYFYQLRAGGESVTQKVVLVQR